MSAKLPFATNLKPAKMIAGSEAMADVLNAAMPGWDKNPSTMKTPFRFMKYLAEFSQPIDLESIFGSTFEDPTDHPPILVQHPIPFRGMCEHHLLPMTGIAALGYVPHDKVIGLSKLTRLVDAVGTEQPSLQEHRASRIMNLMQEHLKPKGVMLVIKSKHGCMSCRGVNAPEVYTTTSHVSGVFRDNSTARAEFLSLIAGTL